MMPSLHKALTASITGAVAAATALGLFGSGAVPFLEHASIANSAPPSSQSADTQVGASQRATGTPKTTGKGRVYYVDARRGDDADSGLSPSHAWRSLTQVGAAELDPGDVVAFKRGETFTGSATISRGGDATAPISFDAYGTGSAPILTNPGQWNMLELNAPYLTVRNLHFNDGVTFTNNDGTGIRGPKYELSGAIALTDAATGSDIENNVFTKVGVGVKSYATDTMIAHNTFRDLQIAFRGEDSGTETSYGAIAISLDNSDEHVAYNSFINCRSTDSPYGADGGAIEIEGFDHPKDNIRIDHNHSVDSQGFLEVTETTASDVTLSYNVSDDYQQFIAWDTTTTPSGFTALNNTVVRRHDTFDSPLFDVYYYREAGPSPAANWLTSENNIFDTPYGTVFGPFNWPHDHNLFWGSNGDPVGYALSVGDIIADPRFADYAKRDLELSVTSPAISGGVDTATTTDLAGNPTKVNGVDIGAYEYQRRLSGPAGGLVDGGFENQAALSYTTSPWRSGGSLYSGIDVNAGKAHSGKNDAWLSSNGSGYLGLVEQTVEVRPDTLYRYSVWVRNSANLDNAWIGAKTLDGDILNQIRHGSAADYTQFTVTFNSGHNRSIVVFAGYWGPGPSAWEQIDDAALTRTRP